MASIRKSKLVDLGADVLAEALLDLSLRSKAVDEAVERLIAKPKENVQRFKKKLAGLKRSRKFIEWKSSAGFARDLEMLLEDLGAGVDDPLTAVELIAAFYETDENVFNRCDDSSGHVGDVFRYDAKDLFVEYASRCTAKECIAKIVLKLNRKNDYGVRDTLVHCAGKYLPETVIRSMITTLQKHADKENDDFDKRHYLMLIESLAKQIKDAELFKRTRIASWGKLSTAALIDIAEVYLESGEVETALSWIEKIPDNETFQAYERDKLLQKIYFAQGNTDKLIELLYKKFRSYHSEHTLQELLEVIGHDKKDEVIREEVPRILEATEFDEADARFLILVDRIDEAEEYLLQRAELLDGNLYERLLTLAETMEARQRHLAASLIYRSMLVSILERGYTKAYTHGVRYLRTLDNLAITISNWKQFTDHETFKDLIRMEHGRKRSFWSKYDL